MSSCYWDITNIINRYLLDLALLFFSASTSKGAASVIFNAFGMLWPRIELSTFSTRSGCSELLGWLLSELLGQSSVKFLNTENSPNEY